MYSGNVLGFSQEQGGVGRITDQMRRRPGQASCPRASPTGSGPMLGTQCAFCHPSSCKTKGNHHAFLALVDLQVGAANWGLEPRPWLGAVPRWDPRVSFPGRWGTRRAGHWLRADLIPLVALCFWVCMVRICNFRQSLSFPSWVLCRLTRTAAANWPPKLNLAYWHVVFGLHKGFFVCVLLNPGANI